MDSAIQVFCCYARKDQLLLEDLKTHLMLLQREGLITLWADTDIDAGKEWEKEVSKHLNTAQIILLLISADFMNSDYCYSIEMKRALERHEQEEACVIPVILRPVHWQNVLGQLQALPKEGKPIKSWPDPEDAFLSVAEGIRKVVEELNKKKPPENNNAAICESSSKTTSTANNIFSTSTPNQTSWRKPLAAELNEFLLLWTRIYGKKREKLIDPFLSELQRKLILTSERLIVLLSRNPDIPAKTASDVGKIAAHLDDLGRMQFFIDGGVSANKFDAEGDVIAESIRTIFEQLK